MGMIFSDMNKTLSVKSCYSKYLFSSAVFILTILLSAAFFINEPPKSNLQKMAEQQMPLLE